MDLSKQQAEILEKIALNSESNEQTQILRDVLKSLPLKAIIVIGGTGRCGTSWIQRWLLTHPETYGTFNEASLLFSLAKYAAQNEEDGLLNCSKRIGLDHKKYLRLAGEMVHKIISDPDFARHYLLHKNSPKAKDRKKERAIFVEKTPRNVLVPNEIYQMMSPWAPTYTLHIYRDGRSYIESMLRMEWNEMSPKQHAEMWIKIMKRMIDEQFPPNTMHIKYETLVTNPAYSQEISKFLNIPHEHDIKPFVEILADGMPGYDPERYKNLLNQPNIVQCFETMKPILQQLGYET